jgi:hypothetical protein
MDSISLIASILPHAVTVALSPLPIVAIILLLLSNRAKLNSLIFLIGWIIALFINVGAFMVIFDHPLDSSKGVSPVLFYVYLILGLFFLAVAMKEWKMMPKADESPKTPKWMKAIDNMSPVMAFVLAFGFALVNAKNTVVNIAAGVQIGQSTSSGVESVTVLIVYVFVASLSIIIPVVAFLIMGNKLNRRLESLKEWFLYHNASILFVLFLVMGFVLISKAFSS